MVGDYETVFEVSYWSNGQLLVALGFLSFGLLITAGVLTGKLPLDRGERNWWVPLVWCPAWVGISLLLVIGTVCDVIRYRAVLRSGECPVAEGVVQVVRSPGKSYLVRIGGVELTVNYRNRGMAYHDTPWSGGPLRDGVQARVYHYRGLILKVEVQR